MTETGEAEAAHVDMPTESKCPECGGEPDDESSRRYQLSAMGYLHQDVRFVCSDCEFKWSCGVPVDGSDEEPDFPGRNGSLWCDSCDSAWMLVHRVAPKSANVELHLKCPNPNCHYFTRVRRKTGPNNHALVGYPQLTGNLEDCTAFGYPSED